MSENYNDIINKSHHVSQSRPHLPQSSRAAQFASFAALTGYEDAIDDFTNALHESGAYPKDIDFDINCF